MHCDFIAVQLYSEPVTSHVFWKSPLVGTYKTNVSSSFYKDKDFLGIGAVIRDHEGACLASLSLPTSKQISTLATELMWLLLQQ